MSGVLKLCSRLIRASKMTPRSTGTSACDTGTQRECGRPSSLITVRRITRLSFLALRTKRFLCGFLLCTLAQALAVAQTKPEEVVFSSGGPELHGFLWKPEGTGPFPAIVWNHGSEKLPGSQPALAKFYTAHSYVFFVPHRRGQGRSPGNYIQDLVVQAPPGERARRMVELQQAAVVDVIAGLNYLKSRPFVDPARIAPGAMSWEQNVALQDRLVRAVDLAKAPVFLLQAANDYSLAPSRVLSEEANKKKKDFQSKIYPAFGSTHQDGHWGFCSSATDVWGNDVLAFLETQMKASH